MKLEIPKSNLFIDLTNKKFNQLLVKSYAGKKNSQTLWLCLCDCGKEKIIRGSDLKKEKTKSCGCLKKQDKKIDLIGQKFGKLHVIEYIGMSWKNKTRNKGHKWKCLCDCGKIIVALGMGLKSGKRVSCGCIRKGKRIDLTNKTFGKLYVIQYIDNKNGQPYWKCKCDCGNFVTIAGNSLKSGKSKSCGCNKGRIIHGLSRDKKKYKKYLLSDPVRRIKHNIGNSVRKALNNIEKGGKTFDYLPYTPKELKEHLESQFEDWMNWDNYGGRNNDKRKTWHIDHIIPQNQFKYTSLEDIEFKKCWALSNLRPLEKIENMKKGCHISK